MHYFSRFPNVAVSLDATGIKNPIVMTDITRRFTINNLSRDSTLVYYSYAVKDGERPDIIAFKYYKDQTLDWLVLLANEIHDPYFQWYMSTRDFENYVRQKYGSISVAQANVHHYEWIKQARTQITNSDGERIDVPERYLIVDRTTNVSLPASDRSEVTDYDYEVSKNEKRRNIVLIDRSLVPGLLENYRTVLA